VRIEPELRSAKLPLEGDLDVLSRHGCDIAPVDVSTPEGRLRLRSYVWPDQTARLQRLDGAIALARQHPFLLEKADASAFLRRRLAARPANAAFVLLHSIMWQYLPHDTQASIIAALDEAGASTAAPVAWLRMEPLDQKDSFATLSLTSWPGGERRHLARCDYHGRWIEWTE
jgi:hypothetical protein